MRDLNELDIITPMHRLTARDLRRSRPHLLVLRLIWMVVAVSVGVAWLSATSVLDYRRPALWSGEYVSFGLMLTILVGLLAVWYVPRATWATATVVGLIGLGLAPEHAEIWWVVVAAGAALLAFVVIRDRRSVPTGERIVPNTGVAWERSWAAPSPARARIGFGLLAVLALAAVGLLVAHQIVLGQVADFEAGASSVTTPITEIDDENGYLTVSIDGTEHEFEDPWYGEDIAVGDTVEVLTGADGTVRLAGAGQSNPAWLLGVAAALPMAAAAAWSILVAPGLRRRRLIEQGAPGVTVRVVCNGEVALVLPVDASWPALELTHIAGHVDGERVEALIDSEYEEAWHETEDVEEDFDDEVPAARTPAELGAWADGMRAEIEREETEPEILTTDEKRTVEALVGPDTNGAEAFILVGSRASGSTVALARATGQVWLAQIDEPAAFKGRRRLLKSLQLDRAEWEVSAGPETTTERLAYWARRHAVWTRWVAALGAAAVGSLLLGWIWSDGPVDWFDGLFWAFVSLMWLATPFWATSWSTAEFGRMRGGMGTYGFVLDDVIARDRVEAIGAGKHAVGVRLRNPEAVIGCDPEVVLPNATPERAAAELQRWLASARPGARSGSRPTPALISSLLMVVAVVLQSVFQVW